MSSSNMDIEESAVEQHRNWLELPWDVTMTILKKSGTLEILESAQFVCKLWFNLSKDPSMWRVIHIENLNQQLKCKHEKMMLYAIKRSANSVIVLSIDSFGSDNLLLHISTRASHLKRLRLSWCRNVSVKTMVTALKKLVYLEELELTFYGFGAQTSHIIRSCPSLTTFKLNKLGWKDSSSACDREAFEIAGNMPKLRHLQLIGNDMTNVGLTAILDGCPHLRCLDLRSCFHLNLMGRLGERLAKQMKYFRHPLDYSEDYNFEFEEMSADEDYKLPGTS